MTPNVRATEGSARILLVDDEQSVQTLLTYPLRKDGYEVVSALDGREALDRFAEQRFDLVVLDIMLPKLDGIEVCRRLRSRSQVPIIMLTAKDDEIDKVLGLEMGADDYITKPFSVREFRSRVKAALRRAEMLRGRPGGEEPIVAGELEIDFERRAVTARGEAVRLTYVEFEILSTLAGTPGKVMTREMLLEQVWGDSAYRDPRTIDVHIRHLREKLERDPRQPEYLLTVRGVGYRFRDEDELRELRPQPAGAAVLRDHGGGGRVHLPLRGPPAALEPDRREAEPARAGRDRAERPARRGDDGRDLAGAPARARPRHRPAHRLAGDRARVSARAPAGPEPSFVVADSELERTAVLPSYPAAAAAARLGVGGERGRDGRRRAARRVGDRALATAASRAGSPSSRPTSPTSTTTSP